MEKNIEFFLNNLNIIHPELQPVFLLILKKHYQKMESLEKLICDQYELMKEVKSIKSEANDIMICLRNLQNMMSNK